MSVDSQRPWGGGWAGGRFCFTCLHRGVPHAVGRDPPQSAPAAALRRGHLEHFDVQRRRPRGRLCAVASRGRSQRSGLHWGRRRRGEPAPNLAGYARMLNPLGFVPQSFQVVPGIVPDHRGPSVPHRPITRQSLGVGDSDFVITVVGSVGPRKNQLLAVQAVCAASRMAPMPHVRLVLLGTMQVAACTDQLTDAAQLCEGAQVLFKGHVPHANVSAHVAVADLHLSTSTAEVAPVNVFEALMAGVPGGRPPPTACPGRSCPSTARRPEPKPSCSTSSTHSALRPGSGCARRCWRWRSGTAPRPTWPFGCCRRPQWNSGCDWQTHFETPSAPQNVSQTSRSNVQIQVQMLLHSAPPPPKPPPNPIFSPPTHGNSTFRLRRVGGGMRVRGGRLQHFFKGGCNHSYSWLVKQLKG